MNRVHILVEGQTEESFVKTILAPHLHRFGVHAVAILLTTKRVKAGGHFKGGVTSYSKVKRDVQRLLGDSSARAVTTMIDFYGLPQDFPGKGNLSGTTCYERVEQLEEAFKADVGEPRFMPYLSLHEFESLLLVSPETVATAFPDRSNVEQELKSWTASVSPEEVDEGPESHPAARLQRLLPGFRKALHGPLITARIGLEAIRDRCRHFNAWVESLQRLGGA